MKKHLLTLTLVIAYCFKMFGQDTLYVSDMPSPEKISQQIRGINLADTYAKQSSAALLLIDFMDKVWLEKVGGGFFSNAENSLREKYKTYVKTIEQNYSRDVAPLSMAQNKMEWNQIRRKYDVDADFKSYVIKELSGPKVFNRLQAMVQRVSQSQHAVESERQAKQQDDLNEKAAKNKLKMTRWAISVSGVLVFLLAIFMIRRNLGIVSKAREYEFENTTDGGVVQFDSFKSSQQHNIKLLKARYRLYLAAIFLVGGLAMIIGGFYFE